MGKYFNFIVFFRLDECLIKVMDDCFSQLYRSSSFNSSGCGSGGEPADDMYSDVSLEEDVQGLNYKVSGNYLLI